MITFSQVTHTRRNRRGPIVVLLPAAIAVLFLTAPTTAVSKAANRSSSSSSSYGWPVKPFGREHPVRGSFGDPRTIFRASPTLHGLMHGHGDFSFHKGIDISAPNGTAVYPVASGVVTHVDRESWIRVDSDESRAFEYWHIRPAVRVGDQVYARRTILGYVLRPAGHVHLTERIYGERVNPLAPGHIAPYTDRTRPAVTEISFRHSDGQRLLPNLIRGRVTMVAAAHDMPSKAAPGLWRHLPVTPAVIKWALRRWPNKIVAHGVTRDVRLRLPSDWAFWSTFARGTFQNMAVFGRHYSYLQTGAYLFNLSPRPFDTRSLPDGVYELIVTASDIRGNAGSLAQRFTIHNSRR